MGVEVKANAGEIAAEAQAANSLVYFKCHISSNFKHSKRYGLSNTAARLPASIALQNEQGLARTKSCEPITIWLSLIQPNLGFRILPMHYY